MWSLPNIIPHSDFFARFNFLKVIVLLRFGLLFCSSSYLEKGKTSFLVQQWRSPLDFLCATNNLYPPWRPSLVVRYLVPIWYLFHIIPLRNVFWFHEHYLGSTFSGPQICLTCLTWWAVMVVYGRKKKVLWFCSNLAQL